MTCRNFIICTRIDPNEVPTKMQVQSQRTGAVNGAPGFLLQGQALSSNVATPQLELRPSDPR